MPKLDPTILLLGYARVQAGITPQQAPQSKVVLIVVAPYALRGLNFSKPQNEPVWYAITT